MIMEFSAGMGYIRTLYSSAVITPESQKKTNKSLVGCEEFVSASIGIAPQVQIA